MLEGNPQILEEIESYKSEIEEKEKEFIQPVTVCYEILKSLNEDFALPSEKHSEEWNKTFNTFYLLSAQIAESLWPKKTVKYIKDSENQLFFESDFNSTNYPLPRYEDVIRDSVKNYTGFYISKKDKNKIPKEITFWKFYRYLLLQKVSSNYADIQIEKHFNLNSKQKAKFKSICFFFHSTNIEDIFSDQAKALLIKEKIFNSQEQLNSFYRLLKNRDSRSSSYIEELDFNKSDIFNHSQKEENIEDYLDLIEKAFIQKMNLKKQADEEQENKIIRTKEYLSLYVIEKFLSENPNLSYDQVDAFIKGRKFYSAYVAKIYKEREKQIQKVICELKQSNEKSLYKQLREIKKAPITYKEISQKNNKPYNYVSRELSSFLDYLKNFTGEKKDKTLLNIEDLKEELNFYNNFFTSKMKKKNQKIIEQEKKIAFEKDIATYVLLQKITKEYKEIKIEDLEKIIKDYDFASQEIIQSFKQVKPLTLKEISLKNGRNEKYASKRSFSYKNLLN